MGVFPKTYNKKTFKEFLLNNNVDTEIIQKFLDLPDSIIHNENIYELYINSIWYSIGDTYYNFELNYYCNSKIEFLFNSKVYSDIELCINYLMIELNKNIKQ